MPGRDIVISTAEGRFDCYLSVPQSAAKAPGIVMASTVFGVDADLKKMCDDLAEQGFLAAAPDFFWRGDKGPLPRTEEGSKRAGARAEDRVGLAEERGRGWEFLRCGARGSAKWCFGWIGLCGWNDQSETLVAFVAC